MLLVGTPLAVTLACGGGSGRPPAEIEDDSGVVDVTSTDVVSLKDSTPESATETGADTGSAGEGGDASDAEAEASPVAPECSQMDTWSTTVATIASIPSADFARFGGVSADEKTVAWSDASGDVFVADRASPTAAFSTPAQVPAGAQQLASDRVAVNPTGTVLITTLAGGAGFASFVRTGPGGSWSAGSAQEFTALAATISESGGSFSEPVLSADGLSLFYVLAIGPNLPVFYESAWDTAKKAWALGTPLSGADFTITTTTQLRRPTGASSDRLTLFFFDEVAGHERAAWREFPTSPFDFFVDLPSLPEAAPNQDCLTLYFQSSGGDAGAPGLGTAQ